MLWLKFPNLRQLLNLLVQLCVEFRQFCIRSRGDIISHTTLSGLSRPTRTHFHPAMRVVSRHVDIRVDGTRLENRGLPLAPTSVYFPLFDLQIPPLILGCYERIRLFSRREYAETIPIIIYLRMIYDEYLHIKYGLQSNFSGHSISIYPANCRNLSRVESPNVSSSCATHQCFSE